MRSKISFQVFPARAFIDYNSGKRKAVGFDACHFDRREIGIEYNRLKSLATAALPDSPIEFTHFTIDQPRHSSERALSIVKFVGDHRGTESRPRYRECPALAINDFTARCFESNSANEISLRTVQQIRRLDHLKLEEAQDEDREDRCDKKAQQQNLARKKHLVAAAESGFAAISAGSAHHRIAPPSKRTERRATSSSPPQLHNRSTTEATTGAKNAFTAACRSVRPNAPTSVGAPVKNANWASNAAA